MYPHNMNSLKMEIAKSYQNKDRLSHNRSVKNIKKLLIKKDYIKSEIENEKKFNEFIKNCKTKDPLLHKEYVKNIKKMLLKNKTDIVIIKTNTSFFDKNKIVIYDDVHPCYSAVIYDSTE